MWAGGDVRGFAYTELSASRGLLGVGVYFYRPGESVVEGPGTEQ